MLCAYDLIQHDFRTDTKPLKMTGFLDCRTDGTDTILLKLKIKKNI